jgi:hypothetical protein
MATILVAAARMATEERADFAGASGTVAKYKGAYPLAHNVESEPLPHGCNGFVLKYPADQTDTLVITRGDTGIPTPDGDADTLWLLPGDQEFFALEEGDTFIAAIYVP